jgi:serine protease AprX
MTKGGHNVFGYRDVIEDLLIEKLINGNEELIPVIITADDCECDDLEKFVQEKGGTIKHKLPIINAVAAYIPTIGVRNVARERAISKIFLDDRAYKLMDTAPVTVGSDYANEYGLTGKGVAVAVIDTGVYPHADLVIPVNRIIGFKDFVGNNTEPYDDDGHGTHVAGIIAGNGFASTGKYMGIAPDANIVGVKVLDSDGSGSISDVIAGIQWTIQNKEKYGIKVLTLSLGTKAKSSYLQDPLCKAVDAAVKAGITVSTAGGNSGPDASTINSPAISPNVIAVGAYSDRISDKYEKGTIADFSSRGPTPDGFVKPDILAPGVSIHSLQNQKNSYATLSGTSMAAPIVAGCATLLYENNPNLTPENVKSIIMSNAKNLNMDKQVQGSGLLDIRKILDQLNISPQEPINPPPQFNNNFNGLYSIFDGWFIVFLIVILLLVL